MSLLDVLSFYAKSFIKQFDFVAAIEQELAAKKDGSVGRAASQLRELGVMAGAIGLSAIQQRTDALFKLWQQDSQSVSAEILLHESKLIRGALLDELSKILFLIVADRDYFEGPLLSPGAASMFPRSDQELRQAGRCFALEQYTAAVFHSMRTLEYGLRALAARLGIKERNPNWQTLIDKIEATIRRMGGEKKTPHRRRLLEFSSAAALHFRFVKDAWRNHAVHAHSNYDRNRAEEILKHTREVVEQIAAAGIREPD